MTKRRRFEGYLFNEALLSLNTTRVNCRRSGLGNQNAKAAEMQRREDTSDSCKGESTGGIEFGMFRVDSWIVFGIDAAIH
jgi:hypothetical protein